MELVSACCADEHFHRSKSSSRSIPLQQTRWRSRHNASDIDALTSVIDNLKISTLMNAAKISPHIHERTIGPQVSAPQPGPDEDSDSNESENNRLANGRAHQVTSRAKTQHFRTDVWREVNIDEDEETPRKLMPLNDCKLVSFRLAAKSAEKERRSQINSDLQEKQSKFDSALEQRLQQIRIESAAEAQKRIQRRIHDRETSLQAAIKQIEDEAKDVEEQQNNETKLRMEQNQKLLEHIKQLRRSGEIRTLLEAVNTNKVLFINLYEAFAKSVTSNQAQLHHINKLDHYKTKSESMLSQYERVLNAVNAKQVTSAEVEALQHLCDEARAEQDEVHSDVKRAEEDLASLAAASAAAAEERRNAEVASVVPATEVSVVDGSQAQVSAIAVSSGESAHPARLAFYNQLMSFYDECRGQVQPLLDDANMKKFRFNCQKAVNTPVNAISAVSPQHLEDKYVKLRQLLSGMSVVTGDVQFSAAEHPLGIQYCTILLAKKFVNQATTISTSSNPHSAFPIAAVIVSIWQVFPHFGQLFLALLYKQCPFFVPYFVPHTPSQSEKDYFM